MKCVYENPKLGLRIYEEPEHDGRVVEVRAATIEGRALCPANASADMKNLYYAVALRQAMESLGPDDQMFGEVDYSDAESTLMMTLPNGAELGLHAWVYARIKAWPPLESFTGPMEGENR